MDFALTAEQQQIRDEVLKLCARFDDGYWLERDRTATFPDAFFAAMAEGNWLGIAMPEAYGGAGLGITEAAILMQAVAESGACMSGASAIHLNIFGLNPVVVYGTEAQKQRMLPPIDRRPGQGLLRGHGTECRPQHHADHHARRAPRRPLRDQRHQDLDLHRAGRHQDPAAGAHHAAR